MQVLNFVFVENRFAGRAPSPHGMLVHTMHGTWEYFEMYQYDAVNSGICQYNKIFVQGSN